MSGHLLFGLDPVPGPRLTALPAQAPGCSSAALELDGDLAKRCTVGRAQGQGHTAVQTQGDSRELVLGVPHEPGQCVCFIGFRLPIVRVALSGPVGEKWLSSGASLLPQRMPAQMEQMHACE